MVSEEVICGPFLKLFANILLLILWDALIAQLVKNLPSVQETLARFPGREDPLENGQATHSSINGSPW